ncbi:MAG: SlyX family protein [Proteobacteria bacterium]|nr:SlyX family protein [Pseudomonadota bacterium]
MTDRLENVEIRIAYLEQANTELSEVVYKLRQEIEALRAEFATLTQRWEASQSAGTAYTAEQEIPPHY